MLRCHAHYPKRLGLQCQARSARVQVTRLGSIGHRSRWGRFPYRPRRFAEGSEHEENPPAQRERGSWQFDPSSIEHVIEAHLRRQDGHERAMRDGRQAEPPRFKKARFEPQ